MTATAHCCAYNDGMPCRVERGATPRRLVSELGSQADSMSVVPPLPASMLRFSGQPSTQKKPSTEHSEPVTFEDMPQSKQDVDQSKPDAVGGQPANAQQPQQRAAAALQLPHAAASAGVGAAAGAAAGMAAASATKPKTAEQTNHISRVSISLKPASPGYSTMCLVAHCLCGSLRRRWCCRWHGSGILLQSPGYQRRSTTSPEILTHTCLCWAQ